MVAMSHHVLTLINPSELSTATHYQLALPFPLSRDLKSLPLYRAKYELVYKGGILYPLGSLHQSVSEDLHSLAVSVHSYLMGLDYYTSERFIHDELARRAESGFSGLYTAWKTHRKIEPFIIAWPSDSVTAENGKEITGPCVMILPPDKGRWQEFMLKAIELVTAYGLLLVEQREKDVRAIFESQHGTRCWTMPIVRSGDVDILKAPEVSDNTEHLGLLWEDGAVQG